jgi:hypothetical protein
MSIFYPQMSRGKEELWESASRCALSMSDLQFLSDLETLPVDHYLHGAAVDVEEIAYTFIAKQVDSVVSGISRQILSTQKKECDKQGQREVEARRPGKFIPYDLSFSTKSRTCLLSAPHRTSPMISETG